jgi:glucose/arabinose dehydrogenase
MNYENIEFKKLFSPKECIYSYKLNPTDGDLIWNIDNIDKEFNAHQSGGRIVGFDDNNIFLSVGDYKSRYLAQEEDSVNGKIIKININNSDYEIFSMGHRNPQGLYFGKENNFILETEHGPLGGDEINLIKFDKLNKNKIPNYGWSIVSAGEHYGGKTYKGNKLKYEKYPLYKSHKKHGFIEPLKSFVPSIAISEITKISNNYYVISSLKDKSLYFFELNKENKIIYLSRVEVFVRVRDIIYKDEKLYLFLEDTASIGIIEIN